MNLLALSMIVLLFLVVTAVLGFIWFKKQRTRLITSLPEERFTRW